MGWRNEPGIKRDDQLHVPDGCILMRKDAHEADSSLVGLKYWTIRVAGRHGFSGNFRTIQRLTAHDGGTEIARAGLREEKFYSDGMVWLGSIDMGRVHVAAGLQTHLAVEILLMDVRFAGNADRDLLIADGDGDRIVVIPVQNDRIARRDHNIEDLKEAIFHHQVMMWFLVHGDYGRRLGGDWQGQKTESGKKYMSDFHVVLLL
jgi:hypothetical protein